MNDNDLNKIFWPAFFLVTGISFLLFSKVLLWLDGTRQPVFNWVGLIAILIGSIICFWKIKNKAEQ